MVAAHRRITWSGTLGSASQPVEIWQFSLHYADSIGVANGVNTANALLTAWGDHLAGLCCKTAKCTQVKIAKISDQGKTSEAPVLSTREPASAVVAALLPYQTSLAVTMRSDKYGKGPLTHGRFYIPVPGFCQITELDRIQNIAAVADKLKSFLQAVTATMSAVPANRLWPILVSNRTPEYAEVTSFSVGDVLDTQRRRRNKLKEVRTPITL